MNKFLKKTVATLAISSLIGSTIPLSASAVSYDPCDVNHDGSVDILDVTKINKYLLGKTSSANYNQLDANRNMIVDACDSDCIMAKVVENDYIAYFYSRKTKKAVSFSANSTNPVLNVGAGSTAPRFYKKYSYVTKGEPKSYSLTPSTEPINANSGISTYAIIGDKDDRKEANGNNENTGIVRYYSDLHNGNFVSGTGFIVGKHVIATAAHCVYNYDESYYAEKSFFDNMTI